MSRHTHLSALALAAASLLCMATPAHAASANERSAFPRLHLTEAGASGQRAIDLLGEHLPAVAAWYRRSPEALREMLLRDHLLHLDRHGRLYAVDELDAPLPASVDTLSPPLLTATTPASLDQTFKLHSLVGAKRTVYLNFKGTTLTNTAWNGSTSTLTAQPYDIDGNAANFSDTELQRIQYIWQRVAEDFTPFAIDVTTEAPTAAKLTRANDGDSTYGTTVLITNNNGVYNCSCGGVAYVGVFDDVGDFYKPALVFWNMLGNGDEKYVAEAISHEAGHNLGLSHDGYSGGGYYPGQGSGATGWAPIMGVGYYQPVVQWSMGEYATANNTEDDIVVIGNNGGTLRKDDHGNSISVATPLTATASGGLTLLSAKGVIERRTDKDVFSFVAGAGTVTLTVAPDSRSPNLDVSIKLLDASNKQLAKSAPADQLAASLTFTLPTAGTYYVLVDGVGVGDPLVTGYSDYGSLGQYTVSGSAPAP
jgi:hypothetical protein